MSPVDYSHLFRCSRCNNIGTTYLLKYTPHKVVVKNKCPIHGAKSFVIPLNSLESLIPVIKDSIYRCFKCGERTTIDTIKTKKNWTLIRMNCDTHNNSLPFQKISTNVYDMVQEFEEPKPIVEDSKPSLEEDTSELVIQYCANCGCKVDPNQKVCNLCGAKIVK